MEFLSGREALVKFYVSHHYPSDCKKKQQENATHGAPKAVSGSCGYCGGVVTSVDLCCLRVGSRRQVGLKPS